MEIRVRGQSVAVTMRTPGQDEELAAGFLYTEGLIRNRDDVTGISFCRQGEATDHTNTLNVFLNAAVEFDLERVTRHFYASSSCGLCGKASIDSIHQLFPPIQSDTRISPSTLLALPDRLRAAQPIFDATGGLHAAGLFDLDGKPICVREDVGRHNAVDKVVGAGFLGTRSPMRIGSCWSADGPRLKSCRRRSQRAFRSLQRSRHPPAWRSRLQSTAGKP